MGTPNTCKRVGSFAFVVPEIARGGGGVLFNQALVLGVGTKTLDTRRVNPIRPGLFSRSPGPRGAQRPRCQKSRLTSTN